MLKGLAEAISLAIDGKKDRIEMEELGSLADDIGCSNEDDMAFVRKTIKVLSENITREDLGTALIADRLAMTPRSFYRRFRSISRITPGALIKFYRLEMASRLLLDDSKQERSALLQCSRHGTGGVGNAAHPPRMAVKLKSCAPNDTLSVELSEIQAFKLCSILTGGVLLTDTPFFCHARGNLCCFSSLALCCT